MSLPRKTPNSPLKAKDVIALLKARYPHPSHAFLEQVADGTGARQNRWADAIAMSVWPSRGYEIDGFEVKVSRSDWLSELRNPVKADAVMKYCDRWWLAVGDAAIVQPGELPSTWGLMAVRGGRLSVVTMAPPLKPVPYDAPFVASILRNACNADTVDLCNQFKSGVEEGRQQAGQYERERLAELTKAVDQFEQRSGIKINSYSGPEIGTAVGIMRSMKWRMDALARAAAEAEAIAGTLKTLASIAEIRFIATEFEQAEKEGFAE